MEYKGRGRKEGIGLSDLIDRQALIGVFAGLVPYAIDGPEDDAYARGLDAGYQALVEAPAVDVRPQWISVKDRPPCEYGNYLAVVDGEVMECLYSTPNTGLICAWSTCDAYGFKSIPDTKITHWMPLPEPPKEVE